MISNYRIKTKGGLIPDAEPIDIITRFERIPTTITETAETGAKMVADQVAQIIRLFELRGEKCNIGFSSGKSTKGVYRELLKLHQNEGLNFKNVVAFTIFEYYPIGITRQQSHIKPLFDELFDHIDILPENIHILDGSISQKKISEHCREYELAISAAGGIDLLIIGAGDQGQIALNEAGSYQNTSTRVVALSNASREIATEVFYDIANTPKQGLTIGIGTILNAKKIFLVGWGEDKSDVFSKIIEDEMSSNVPASFLQEHNNISIIIDEAAAANLTRQKTPWLVGSLHWTDHFIRKAILWLCQKVEKPILKLTHQDYIDNHLGQLLDQTGHTYDQINIKLFNDLQHTISGWPGGKPNSDDSTRPVKSVPFPKRVIIFSPHPDDDVISMGGTLLRLCDQGHDVHVAYQTSGNIAVHDDVVMQSLDTARECGLGNIFNDIQTLIKNKQKGDIEPPKLREIKGAIRRAEAKSACRYFGINTDNHVHFLNLPFYETGTVQKDRFSEKDIQIVKDLMRQIKPHQIYAAGDLSDPHGTHRICIEIILSALSNIKESGDDWLSNCTMWLYRGAWQEWGLDIVDMAVPLSPSEVIKKRHAIFRHLSQKDIIPFPGNDKREFWQRAEERTQATAMLYDRLGMAEYQAIEVFVRYDLNDDNL